MFNLTILRRDKKEKGLNRLAHQGLIKTVIGGYWSLTPRLGDMANNGSINAYNLPQGIISHLFRAIANGSSGVISKVGLHTFVDPRNGGGKLNKNTTDEIVKVISINGEEQLFYSKCQLNFALLRGSIADEDGNISMSLEVGLQDVLAQAQATKNSGGVVIVQVLEVVLSGKLRPQDVKIPGMLVDYIVIADEHDHWQTYGEKFNPKFTSVLGNNNSSNVSKIPLCIRKIIARRAYMEILKCDKHPVINLGIGIPEYISNVAREEGTTNFTLTVESGAVGGYPAGGLSFGASIYPQAFLEQSAQFDFYDGGGLDIAFLGFGEIDNLGNVNVGRIGERINGVGGFINISQSAKQLVFCGTFTASGLEVECDSGKLNIIEEGKIKKFIKQVQQINFNAKYSAGAMQSVKYITERGVFELINNQLVLTEVAPGIDIEKDILSMSDLEIVVSDNISEMDSRIFYYDNMKSYF